MKSKIWSLKSTHKIARSIFSISFLLVILFSLALVPEVIGAEADDEALSEATILLSGATDTQTCSDCLAVAEATSRFGPHRTSPDYGMPRHAYSPFDDK